MDQHQAPSFEAEASSTTSTATKAEEHENKEKVETEEEEDTIDESVWQTIWRDMKAFGIKIFHVLFPHGRGPRALRDWDLWGPLLLCFGLEAFLNIHSTTQIQGVSADGLHALIFTIVWVVIWAGSVLVTLNTQLIGGNLSFFQCVCLLGYCLFPLNVAALVCNFIPSWIKLIVVSLCIAWSSIASLSFFAAAVPAGRKALALYPTILFYVVIGSIIIVAT